MEPLSKEHFGRRPFGLFVGGCPLVGNLLKSLFFMRPQDLSNVSMFCVHVSDSRFLVHLAKSSSAHFLTCLSVLHASEYFYQHLWTSCSTFLQLNKCMDVSLAHARPRKEASFGI